MTFLRRLWSSWTTVVVRTVAPSTLAGLKTWWISCSGGVRTLAPPTLAFLCVNPRRLSPAATRRYEEAAGPRAGNSLGGVGPPWLASGSSFAAAPFRHSSSDLVKFPLQPPTPMWGRAPNPFAVAISTFYLCGGGVPSEPHSSSLHHSFINSTFNLRGGGVPSEPHSTS